MTEATASPGARILPLRRGTGPKAVASPSSTSGDAELVNQAIEGLVWARSELFRRHARALVGLMTRLLGSTSDAEDAVQDTFVVAFRDLHQLRDPAAVAGWLRQIAVHQAHRRFRRRKMLAAVGLDSSVSDATLAQLVDPAASQEVRVELSLVDRVLGRLPTKDRMAWMLRYVEGYELTDVARLCECSLATAKRRIAAAQARLGEHAGVEEDGDGEAP